MNHLWKSWKWRNSVEHVHRKNWHLLRWRIQHRRRSSHNHWRRISTSSSSHSNVSATSPLKLNCNWINSSCCSNSSSANSDISWSNSVTGKNSIVCGIWAVSNRWNVIFSEPSSNSSKLWETTSLLIKLSRNSCTKRAVGIHFYFNGRRKVVQVSTIKITTIYRLVNTVILRKFNLFSIFFFPCYCLSKGMKSFAMSFGAKFKFLTL